MFGCRIERPLQLSLVSRPETEPPFVVEITLLLRPIEIEKDCGTGRRRYANAFCFASAARVAAEA